MSVLECKFYAQPLVRRRVRRDDDGEVLGQEKLRSGHLYQLMAYLRAVERDRGVTPSGALVYASPGGSLDERMLVEGYPFRVIWLDLSLSWEALRNQVWDVLSFGRGMMNVDLPIECATQRLASGSSSSEASPHHVKSHPDSRSG